MSGNSNDEFSSPLGITEYFPSSWNFTHRFALMTNYLFRETTIAFLYNVCTSEWEPAILEPRKSGQRRYPWKRWPDGHLRNVRQLFSALHYSSALVSYTYKTYTVDWSMLIFFFTWMTATGNPARDKANRLFFSPLLNASCHWRPCLWHLVAFPCEVLYRCAKEFPWQKVARTRNKAFSSGSLRLYMLGMGIFQKSAIHIFDRRQYICASRKTKMSRTSHL